MIESGNVAHALRLPNALQNIAGNFCCGKIKSDFTHDGKRSH